MDNLLFLQYFQHTDTQTRNSYRYQHLAFSCAETASVLLFSLPSLPARLSLMMTCCNLAGISSYP